MGEETVDILAGVNYHAGVGFGYLSLLFKVYLCRQKDLRIFMFILSILC